MAPSATTTRTIHLHLPSRPPSQPPQTPTTQFTLSPYQSLAQILQGVRITLDIPYAALYTLDARPITDPGALRDEQGVLVAASRDEVVETWAERGWVMIGEGGDGGYEGSGDWSFAGQGEGIGIGADEELDGFMDLTDAEKTSIIVQLVYDKPTTRNILRITRDWKDVEEEFNALFPDLRSPLRPAVITSKKAVKKNTQPKTAPSTKVLSSSAQAPVNGAVQREHYSEAIEEAKLLIQIRWSRSPDTFLYPAKSRTTHHHDPPSASMINALSLMSSLTHGQARLAREVLDEAVQVRITEDSDDDHGTKQDVFVVPTKEDVGVAIRIIYERAGVLPAKWTKEKKIGAKAKGSSAREKRKKAKEGKERKSVGVAI